MAISILATGYLKPEEAVDYISGLPNIKGVAVGVLKEKHANETFKLLREAFEVLTFAIEASNHSVDCMKYSKHAKIRVIERGISEGMILKAISQPSHTYYDLSTGTTIALKRLDKKHLLVAYSKENGEIKVVTTFITSNVQELMDRKLEGKVWVKIR